MKYILRIVSILNIVSHAQTVKFAFILLILLTFLKYLIINLMQQNKEISYNRPTEVRNSGFCRLQSGSEQQSTDQWEP